MIGKLTACKLSNFDNSQPKGEAAFKASIALVAPNKGKVVESTSKNKRDLESLFAEEVEQEELEALFAKRLPRGKGKYKVNFLSSVLTAAI